MEASTIAGWLEKDREALIPAEAATDEYIRLLPWAVIGEYEWDVQTLCMLDRSIRVEEVVDGRLVEHKPEGASIADEAFNLAMCRAADAGVLEVLKNPERYGLTPIKRD